MCFRSSREVEAGFTKCFQETRVRMNKCFSTGYFGVCFQHRVCPGSVSGKSRKTLYVCLSLCPWSLCLEVCGHVTHVETIKGDTPSRIHLQK